MTTTSTFMGKDDRNSSKVLAPPGGRTSINLFSVSDDPDPAPARGRRQQPPPQPVVTQKSEPAQPIKQESNINPVTGQPRNYSEPQAAPSPSKAKVEKQNPEVLPAAGQRPENKQRLVKKPPGGASSIVLG